MQTFPLLNLAILYFMHNKIMNGIECYSLINILSIQNYYLQKNINPWIKQMRKNRVDKINGRFK